MKVTLNLASQPYVDVSSVIQRLRIIMLVLVVLAVPLFLLLRSEQQKAQIANNRVSTMQSQIRALEKRQQGYAALMRQPQNAAVLNRANYLNSLFRRKSFSWTATMTDLETVLPAGVQVLSLDPAISKSGEVVIQLRVTGARDRAIELVQNLEKSRHFASPRLVGETLAQSANPNHQFQPISQSSPVNFDILADYRPLSNQELKESQAKAAGREHPSAKKASAPPVRKPRIGAKPSAGIARKHGGR